MFEFHVSRLARDQFQFDQSLFSFNGNVILANFHASRTFAQKINQKRDLLNYPEKAVKAGHAVEEPHRRVEDQDQGVGEDQSEV